MLSLLNGCEVRLVTDSVDARAKYYARAMRLRLGLRLALGKCRASNSIVLRCICAWLMLRLLCYVGMHPFCRNLINFPLKIVGKISYVRY